MDIYFQRKHNLYSEVMKKIIINDFHKHFFFPLEITPYIKYRITGIFCDYQFRTSENKIAEYYIK